MSSRPFLSKLPKPSSIITDSIFLVLFPTYWPIASAKLTAIRNLWLPLVRATAVGFSPVAWLYATKSKALSVSPFSARNFKRIVPLDKLSKISFANYPVSDKQVGLKRDGISELLHSSAWRWICAIVTGNFVSGNSCRSLCRQCRLARHRVLLKA